MMAVDTAKLIYRYLRQFVRSISQLSIPSVYSRIRKREHTSMTHHTLFDTGIISNVFRRAYPERERTFWKEARSIGVGDGKRLRLVATPFLLFEFLGRKLPDIFSEDEGYRTQITDLVRTFEGDLIQVDDLMATLISITQQRIAAHPDFRLEAIRTRFEKQVTYLTDEGARLCRSMFHANLANDEAMNERFYWQLALDCVQSIDLRKIKCEAVPNLVQLIAICFVRVLTSDTFNLPFGRTLAHLYRPDEEAESASSAFGYRPWSEAHDTDIVHSVCVGYKENGQLFPVRVFTTERIERFVDRIKAYQSFIRYSDEMVRKHLNKSIPTATGILHWVDPSTGSVKQTFAVTELNS